jgi:hypothetical protein
LIYIVLGMHKSGTTLVSQILHHSGINMGENIDPSVSYDRGNKYERLSTRALNLEILGLEDVFTPSVDPKVPDPLPLTAQQRMRMRKIIQECNRDYRDWGFKDPRTCLVYPLWASELPEHRLIAVFRPHTEVWPHYRRNGLYRYYQNIPRVWRFTRGWYRHQLNVLAYLEKTDMGFLVLSYHKRETEGPAEAGLIPQSFERRCAPTDCHVAGSERDGTYTKADP